MVTQKEIIEVLTNQFVHNHDYRVALADRIEAEGIAPPDGHIIVPTCAVRKKPYVPMTDDEITEATQVMKPDLLHEPTLYCWRQVEKAVIKRAGLEVKHD